MKERLVTFACALGALVLFLAMFLRGDEALDPRRDVSRPTTAERRENGYFAAMSWLEAEGVRAISLRERFDALGSLDLPPRGNLLVVTLPATTGFATGEFLPLDRWVRAGNTLLVVAALSDSPEWAFTRGGLAPADLSLLTGLEFESVRSRDRRLRAGTGLAEDAADAAEERSIEPAGPLAEPRRSTLVPNRDHVFFDGVREAVAVSDHPAQPWTVRVPYEGFVLALASERETGEGALWTRPLGEGRIVVSGFGSLFTNRALGLADNARLFANIVAAAVAEGGAVLFDDYHQGLGATYDPAQFYKDRRLYVTIGVLAALWFLWVLGSTRLRVPVTHVRAPRETELVRTTGGFLARVLRPHAGARRMFEHFFERVRQRTPSPEGSEPWEYLERHPRVSRPDLEALQDLYADALAGRRLSLRRLHNLIVRIDGQIA